MSVPTPDGASPQLPESSADELPPADPHQSDGIAGQRSLFDDFEALIDDARTYYDAELSYQKSRAGLVGNRVKKGIAFGLVAAFFAVLATIALAIGLIIALTPIITAWGATAVVVLTLLLVAYLLVRKAGKAFSDVKVAMASPPKEQDDV